MSGKRKPYRFSEELSGQSSKPADSWRNHRWESFTLNTPNWQSRLPGAGMPGNGPDGFARREEVIRYFEEYVRQNRLGLEYVNAAEHLV